MDVSFNDDATSLVPVGGDGYLAEWSVDSSGQHDVSHLGNGQGRFFNVSYWLGRNGVAVGHENGTIQFFDMAEGRTIGRAIMAHDSFVQALAFSADGSRLASSGAEGEIALWDIGEEAWISVACAIANEVDQSVVRALPLRGDDAYPCGRHPVITPWTEPTLPAVGLHVPGTPTGASMVVFRSSGTRKVARAVRAVACLCRRPEVLRVILLRLKLGDTLHVG